MLTKAIDIPPVGSISLFLVNWQKLTLNHYYVSGKGLHYTSHQDIFFTKNSKFYENEQEANCSRGFGIKGNVDERGNKENSTCSRGISEQLIFCGEKNSEAIAV